MFLMADLINHRVQYKKIAKTYGTTTVEEEELFKNKYDSRYIYSATLWTDADCEFIGDDRNNISNIKVKANQMIVLEDFRPWESLKIKAPIGTNYDILLGM